MAARIAALERRIGPGVDRRRVAEASARLIAQANAAAEASRAGLVDAEDLRAIAVAVRAAIRNGRA